MSAAREASKSGGVIHLRRTDDLGRGDHYLANARCALPCGWAGRVIREWGGRVCPRCPRCGGWTAAVPLPSRGDVGT